MKKLLEQALDALEGAHYVLMNSLRIEDPIEDICIWSYNMGVADAENHYTKEKTE
jgi:hypothetical protein